MAQSPLDDPTFPTAKAYGARATEQSPNEEIARLRQQLEALMREKQFKEDEGLGTAAKFGGRAVLSPEPPPPQNAARNWGAPAQQPGSAREFGGRAQEAIGNLSAPSTQPKKNSIVDSDVFQFLLDVLPSREYIQKSEWPEEAKTTVRGLSSMIIGMVIGAHLTNEQIATYLKDLKDETS